MPFPLYPKESAEDVFREDFSGKASLARFRAVGIPSGEPRASVALDLSGGGTQLVFSYKRDKNPVPVLAHWVPVRDFRYMEFMIKAEKPALWVVSVKDSDGAVFSAKELLPADKWRKVIFRSSDFKCNNDSPVKKDFLDTGKLKCGYAAFDAFSVFRPDGTRNSVSIDRITVAGKPLKLIKGPLLVDGKSMTLDVPAKIQGDIILKNGAHLTVNCRRLILEGSIFIIGSTFEISDCLWSLPQKYSYQWAISSFDKGKVRMENVFIDACFPVKGGAAKRSDFRMSASEFLTGSFTFSLDSESFLEMKECRNTGEFIIHENTGCLVENSDRFLLWLVLMKGPALDIELRPETRTCNWTAPKTLRRLLQLNTCRNVQWGIIATGGCDVKFHNSKLRAAGLHFGGDGLSKVSGLKNGTFYNDFKIDTGMHKLHFVDSEVQAWNFYADGGSRLLIRDCFFGESISFKNSMIGISGSTCDGSGGYLGAKGDSVTQVFKSRISCNVITHDNAALRIKDSVIKGNLEATGASSITLTDSSLDGKALEFERGRILRNRTDH